MEGREELLKDSPFELSDADREVLGQRDEEFVPHTWEELKEVIGKGAFSYSAAATDQIVPDLHHYIVASAQAIVGRSTKDTSTLRRTPTGLANYIRWTRQTLKTYDSVAAFVRIKTLGWAAPSHPTAPKEGSKITAIDLPIIQPISPNIFEEPADHVILRNDWPYGCEPGVEHLVVWLKNRIPIDDKLGDPTLDAEARISNFIHETFLTRIKKAATEYPGSTAGSIRDENCTSRGESSLDERMEVMWFRNRTRWQSVRALEHIHVLLRNVPEPLIQVWTGQNATDTISERWARGERE